MQVKLLAKDLTVICRCLGNYRLDHQVCLSSYPPGPGGCFGPEHKLQQSQTMSSVWSQSGQVGDMMAKSWLC